MHLSKRKAQLLAAGVLGGFFLIGMLLTSTQTKLGVTPKIELGRSADGSMQARVVIGEFSKSESKDGKKVWEVTATTAKYFPDTNTAELENGIVLLYRGNDVVKITSKQATVQLKGATLDRVVTKGDVVVHSEARGVTLTTDEAIFNKAEETLECPGFVTIVAPQGEISGDGLRGDTGASNFTFLNNVKTRLKAENELASVNAAQKKETKR